MAGNLIAHPAQLLHPTTSKFCHYAQIVVRNIAINSIDFSLDNLSPGFCWLVIPLIFRQKLFMSINNITVLVSDNVICFGHFMLMIHGVDKKACRILFPTPLHCHVFTRFVCYFLSNALSTFLFSDHINAKNNAFSK